MPKRETVAATSAGFALCAVALAAGQTAMSCFLTPGAAQNSGVVQDIGYTFTGLTAAIGYILWRWGRAERNSGQTITRSWLTKMLQAAVAIIPALLGCVYFCMAGEYAEQHARTFAVMPPLMYLLTIKRQNRKVSAQ
ncbi:MAG: hypothetical protein LBQ86_07885 [Holophagales bacterium]|jgi:hypothetical protein|nr:hypothetical protein [Holophagales bacterium]